MPVVWEAAFSYLVQNTRQRERSSCHPPSCSILRPSKLARSHDQPINHTKPWTAPLHLLGPIASKSLP